MNLEEFIKLQPNFKKNTINLKIKMLQEKLKSLHIENDININPGILHHISKPKINAINNGSDFIAYIEKLTEYYTTRRKNYKEPKPTIDKRKYSINELLQGLIDLVTIIENIPYSEYAGNVTIYNHTNAIYKNLKSLRRGIAHINTRTKKCNE